jgi:hypothetical protein
MPMLRTIRYPGRSNETLTISGRMANPPQAGRLPPPIPAAIPGARPVRANFIGNS